MPETNAAVPGRTPRPYALPPAGLKLLAAALAASFLARLAYVLHSGSAFAYPDEDVYHQIALDILSSGFSPDSLQNREPLYPLLVAVIYKIAGAAPLAVKLLQAGLSAAGAYFVYRTAALLFNGRAALIALAIAALYPFSVFYDARLLRESLLMFLSAGIGLFSLKAAVSDPRYCYAAALFTGLAVLTKVVALFYWPAFVLLGLFYRMIDLRRAALSTLVFVAVLAPLLLINYSGTGRVFLVRGQSFNLYQSLVLPDEVIGTAAEAEAIAADPVYAAGKKLPLLEQDKYFSEQTVSFIKANPLVFIRKTAWKFGKLWRPYPYKGMDYTYSWVLLAAVSLLSDGWLLPLGLFAAVKLAGRRRELFPAYAYVLVLTAIYSLSWSQIRYRLPMMPFFMVFSAYLLDKWTGGKGRSAG
ncbi:MAG: ArnT family glycosyltransferase [Elusimicrobiales bacterium]